MRIEGRAAGTIGGVAMELGPCACGPVPSHQAGSAITDPPAMWMVGVNGPSEGTLP
jgi:hypothetical protein